MQRPDRGGYEFKNNKEGLREIEELLKTIENVDGRLKYQALIDHFRSWCSTPEYRAGHNPPSITAEGEEL